MWDFNINQLLAFDPGKSGFGSNYKTVLCRVYKCEEGDHNTKDDRFGTDVAPSANACASDPQAIIGKPNIDDATLDAATPIAYNAAIEVKAPDGLYTIDGGDLAVRAIEIERKKAAEREREREELMALYAEAAQAQDS